MNKVIYEDVSNILSSSVRWELLNGKTVLVTGGAGFIASYIIDTLLSLPQIGVYPYKIICNVRDIQKARNRFIHHEFNERLVYLQGDVCDITKIDGDVDIIIHAASLASPKHYSINPVGVIDANVIGTRNMLNLAVEKKCSHFLFLSSGEAYGRPDESVFLINETDMGYLDCMQVRTCYAESKRMGENMCVAYSHQYGLNTIIVRPFHTYGPRMNLSDGRVFSDFVSDILQGNDIKLKSDGAASRAFCYISDATIGFFTALLNGCTAASYNIGNPEQEYTIRALAEHLAMEFKELTIKVVYESRDKEDKYLVSPVLRCAPDITKIRRIGWFPRTDVRSGFRRTVESFKDVTAF